MPKTRAFKHILLILGGAWFAGNLHLGIVSLGFGLQVEGGGNCVFGFWASG